MRTVRTLASSAERTPLRRFPAKTLALAMIAVFGAFAVVSFVDKVVPAAPASKAAPEAAAPEKAAAPAEKPRADLLKTDSQPFTAGSLAAVGGVFAAAIAAMFFLKRALKGSRHVPGERKVLKVRDVLALGPKRAIYLIGLEERNLVVGLSGDQLTLLSEYSADREEPAAASAPAEEPRVLEVATTAAPAASGVPALATAILEGEASAATRTAPAEPAAARTPRAFSFAPVTPDSASGRKGVQRVPQKFRELLERAAEAQGAPR